MEEPLIIYLKDEISDDIKSKYKIDQLRKLAERFDNSAKVVKLELDLPIICLDDEK